MNYLLIQLTRNSCQFKISHEEAIKKAEKEFQIYREREMKELQSDFDMLMKSLQNKKESE